LRGISALEAFRSKRNLVWPRRVWRGGVTLIYPGVDREPSAGLVFLFAGLSVLMSIAVEASDSDGPVSMVRSLLAWSAGASFAIRSYS
jgi:hypothetical protein